jgi:glycosyltransferase involved in cell wall biosynthesis
VFICGFMPFFCGMLSAMRVLNLYNVFGAATERAWLNYPLALAGRGHAVTFACERAADEAPAVSQGLVTLERIAVESVPPDEVDAQMQAIAEAPADAALRHLLDEKFDLVHGHTGPRVLQAAPFLLRGVPVVISLYGYDLSRLVHDPAWPARYRWAAERGATFVVLCEAMKRQAIALGIPESRVKVIHVGIELENWPYQPTPAPASPRFVFVGRLTAKKGLTTLIDAFDRLYNRFGAATLEIIGDGEIATELRHLVQYRGLDEPIIFLGAWPLEKIRRRLTGATALVLPSVTAADGDREGTPVVLMESQALGVPCITTDHAGNPEVLPPEPRALRQQFIVPERDAAALEAAMAAMIALPAGTRRELQHAGRRHVEEQFSVASTADAYEALYTEVGRDSPPGA